MSSNYQLNMLTDSEVEYTWSIIPFQSPGGKSKAAGDTSPANNRACPRRRRAIESWRLNAIDPDRLPVACEPCRCHKAPRVRAPPYNFRDRNEYRNRRTLEQIPDEEISEDLKERINSIPIPGRSLPNYDSIPQLSHELKLRLAMTSLEVEEKVPEPGGKFSYRLFRPDTRVIEIHDDIDEEENEHDVTIRIRLENVKKSGLIRRSNKRCHSDSD